MKEHVTPDAEPVKNEEVPLAIIGIGCLFPRAKNHDEFWANIKNGVDSITEVPKTHWSPDDYFDADPRKADHSYARRGGFISPVDFDPLAYGIPPSVLEATDTSQLLGMVAAGEALRDAGYGKGRDFDRDRVSVILGVTGTLELVIPLGARLGHPIWRRSLKEAGVDDAVAEDVVQRIADSYVPWQENSFPGLLGNVVAGRISKFLDVGGTNCAVDAACASSLSAIHLAAMELATGRSDMVVTGGIDTFNDIFMYMCFSKTPALSPSGDAKPFDENGDGTILGEGLGVVVLKRLADARRDGDRVYAVIRSIGTSSDGKGEAIYAPSASGQKKAIRRAYAAADVTPDTVELVEAHGTGTRVGDAVEASALKEVYEGTEREGSWCAVGSVKSQIGHTKAAAGVAGLIKAALALHHKVLPPTIKVTKPLEELESGPLYVNTTRRPWVSSESHPRRGAVSAFGFGGSNFHCLLEEADPVKHEADWDGDVQLFTFSGNDASTIRASMAPLATAQSWDAIRLAASASRRSFSSGDRCRLAFVAERDKTDLARLVASTGRMLERSANAAWSTPDGVIYGVGAPDGKLAMIFPGQGSQYVGMLRDLSCLFPQMLDALRDANRAFAEGDERKLTDLIYPPPAFEESAVEKQEDELRAIEVAQPAIGAVSVGAFSVLRKLGVTPEAVAGHSYGELMALCAAGSYDSEALYSLSRLRAQLMASGGADKGTMLAVRAPLHMVEQIVADEGLDLVVANRNAPTQAVLSGAAVEIERALEACSRRKIQSKKIAVAAAFHSPLVAHALAPFLAALREIDFSAAAIPVFANTSAREYPASVDEARELLAGQLASPVDFVSEIRAMHDHGVRTFVEVGPGARLTALVHSILEDREHTAVALDASSGQRSGIADLGRLLAHLVAEGRPVDLSGWDRSWQPPAAPERKPKMTVPISGANHVSPRPRRAAVAPQKTTAVVAQTPAVNAEARGSRTDTAPAQLRQPSAPRTDSSASTQQLSEILRATQESMLALQRMQEQTAQVHSQFLAGQETAARTFQALLDQQTRLIGGNVSVAPPTISTPHVPSAAPVISAAPAPAVPPPAAVAPQPAVSKAPDVSAPAPAGGTNAGIEAVLLEVVSVRTGYPTEMLELDMSLDADLGIDSIKRVEILSTLEERLPDSPRIEAEHLGQLQTLRSIAAHLSAGMPARSSVASPAVAANEVSSASRATIEAVVLDVVSNKTGYPTEMLELDMSLDADLGIDSIKRVEILSALEEQLPDSPRIEAEHLGRLQTLRAIVDHLSTGRAAAASVASAPPVARSTSDRDAVASVVLDVVSGKTGYPVEMLELEMALDADLGIDSIKRVEILSALEERLPSAPRIEAEHLGKLQTLQSIVDHLSHSAPIPSVAPAPAVVPSAAPALSTSVQRLRRSTIVTVDLPENREPIALDPALELWITDDDGPLAPAIAKSLRTRGYHPRIVDIRAIPDGPTAGLVIVAPHRGTTDAFLRSALFAAKNAAPHLRASADRGAILITVSNQDGSFGLGTGDGGDALSGALAGLTKTAAREWPSVHCKALDLAVGLEPGEAADRIVAEIRLKGPVEVGLSRERSTTLELETLSAPSGQVPVDAGDVIVVSGGARGVTATAAIALAGRNATVVLLGRSAEPVEEPHWLRNTISEADIKRAVVANEGTGLTPRDLQARHDAIVANRELTRTIDDIERAGGRAAYRSVDIRDAASVTSVLESVRNDIGPIRGIVHGAGVLADRLIEEKTPEQFDRVYDTKVAGARNLLDATASDDLRFVAFFSSSTARFGRTGQVDYAMANEALNKMAGREAARRPGCRVVSFNWGPWNGGMVTPSLAALFAKEGVGLIEPEAGASLLLEELSRAAGPSVEVVVLAEKEAQPSVTVAESRPAATVLDAAFQLQLNVRDFPFLASHVLNERAVIPMAMMMEWGAQGAVSRNPGMRLLGLDDIHLLKGLTLDGAETVDVRVHASRASRNGAHFEARVEIHGRDAAGHDQLHARMAVLLGDAYPSAPAAVHPSTPVVPALTPAQLYESILFHGVDFQSIVSVDGWSPAGIRAHATTSPAPAAWMRQPLRNVWLADPLAIDSSFQLLIVWSALQQESRSLPSSIRSYRQFRGGWPAKGVEIVVSIRQATDRKTISDVDFVDAADGKVVARIEGLECAVNAALEDAFRRNRLGSSVDV